MYLLYFIKNLIKFKKKSIIKKKYINTTTTIGIYNDEY